MKHKRDTYAYMFFRASYWGGEDRNNCLNEIEPIWRAGLVQLVSASSPSHQVLGSKPFCRGKTLLRLFPYPDPTRMGASGTGSAPRQNRSTKLDTKRQITVWWRRLSYILGCLEEKGIHIQILNITELSDYRKDGHPTVFRKQFHPLTKEQIMNPASYADCIHWCLPGVPDVWNEFLYGYLMYKWHTISETQSMY
jgi:hypothetical protein